MLLLYNLFIRLYFIAIKLASLWNKKAAAWINGRKLLFKELEKKISSEDKIIWMHCSSAGEFEQGKPLIEALKKEYASYKVLVSFFSPSGYEVAKSYAYADYSTYLPLDTKKNSAKFLQVVNPQLVIFIKYEFWYHHLHTVASQNIPLLLVSAVFRKNQIFFKGHGKFFRKILLLFQHVFVQDEVSLALLQENKIRQSSISGDTRFDRVHEIKEHFSEVAFIQNFIGHKKAIVAGSTRAGDEKLLADYLIKSTDIKLIVAPHEITAAHISSLQALFPTAVLYSEYANATHQKESQVLIIDSIGLLSRLYQYAPVTYVGGGFTKDGIHNILEAAVWGKPVFFGSNHKKYREAKELIEAGGGFSIRTAEELKRLTDDLFSNENHLLAIGAKAQKYVEENTGATEVVLRFIQEKRLLTKP